MNHSKVKHMGKERIHLQLPCVLSLCSNPPPSDCCRTLSYMLLGCAAGALGRVSIPAVGGILGTSHGLCFPRVQPQRPASAAVPAPGPELLLSGLACGWHGKGSRVFGPCQCCCEAGPIPVGKLHPGSHLCHEMRSDLNPVRKSKHFASSLSRK